jgi:hypothetical protein
VVGVTVAGGAVGSEVATIVRPAYLDLGQETITIDATQI